MAIPWERVVKRRGKLRVHNKAGGWSGAVTSAIATFNALGFPVQLETETNESSAEIVVVLSNGHDSYPHPQMKIQADFDATQLHGEARTLRDPDRNVIVFAAIFLPGKVTDVTARQKEVIIVHEFIHAAGLNGVRADGSEDPNDDHESVGIMFAQMQKRDGGLLEYLPDKGAQPMTPIRVGPQTRTKINSVWAATSTAATTTP